MRMIAACALSVLIGGVANAQPGQTDPAPYPAPAPAPYPAPAPAPTPAPAPAPPAPPYGAPPYGAPPYGAPPYGAPPYPYPYQPQPQLTLAEQELLAEGEISDGQHLGGGAASIFLGFGTGQAIQGRWSDTGWIFTIGEAGSLVAILAGIATCEPYGCDEDEDQAVALLMGGVIGFCVFRVWEVVDAFAGPSTHNRKVRDLRRRLGYPTYYGQPFVVPTADGDGAVGGLTIRF